MQEKLPLVERVEFFFLFIFLVIVLQKSLSSVKATFTKISMCYSLVGAILFIWGLKGSLFGFYEACWPVSLSRNFSWSEGVAILFRARTTESVVSW